MARRLQFSLRTLFWFWLAIAIVVWPTASLLRSYLAARGLVPVSGVVTLRGQPVANATVTLVPSKPVAKSVKGVTGPQGRFALETLVAPGEYTVVITGGGTHPTQRIPPVFNSAATSGLTVAVRATADNQVNFELNIAD
jgi:hypothetical protein